MLRHLRHDSTKYQDLKYDNRSSQQQFVFRKFCFYLINKIEEKEWQSIFEACIPAINQSVEILNVILPFLIYYSLRFNQTDTELISNIANYINEILNSHSVEKID